jgi:two-component system phosphate regulon sensor histidine kinase PhoR
MRIPLFLRILLILVIPFFQILIITGFLNIPALRSFSINYSLYFILMGFIFTIFLAYLTSKNISEAIRRISLLLSTHENINFSTKDSRDMPLEMENLIFSVKEAEKQNASNQASLIADKQMFNSILENMTDGILIADQNGIVLMINSSAGQIFHVSLQESIKHSLAEVIRDHRINELFEKCSQSHKQEMINIEIAPERTFIQCIATPLDPGQFGSILFLFQNLTRIRQLEIIRRDFVSNVSHELRTPLTSLKLIAETLQQGAIEDPTTAKHFIQKMDAEIDNLTHLVEELLELSRIESGRVPLEKRYVKTRDLLDNACERMVLQAQRAGLTLNNSSKPELPEIFVDPPRLEQVLINLIHNAIKYTAPGGKVEVSAYQESSDIVFSVKDNGKGIPYSALERVFERFYKSDRSRSERGTGLGLSISRRLVEAHNGKIWAESQLGQGSTFYFRIPLN